MTRRLLAIALGVCAVMAVTAPAGAHKAARFYKTGKWATGQNVTYGFTPSVPTGAIRDRTVEAADTWNALGEPMRFERAGDYPADFDPYLCHADYQNGIHVARIDGNGGTLARAMTCWYDTKRMSTFQLVYDGSESWHTGLDAPGGRQPDLLSVAVHEFGHATGFSKHFGAGAAICTVKSTQHTMCPSHLFGSTWQRSLEKHDKHTFAAAY